MLRVHFMSENALRKRTATQAGALAEEELVARVARCYYHDGLTQNDIGERPGLPRLKISRLLEKGRQSGVIRVRRSTPAMKGVWRWKPSVQSV